MADWYVSTSGTTAHLVAPQVVVFEGDNAAMRDSVCGWARSQSWTAADDVRPRCEMCEALRAPSAGGKGGGG